MRWPTTPTVTTAASGVREAPLAPRIDARAGHERVTRKRRPLPSAVEMAVGLQTTRQWPPERCSTSVPCSEVDLVPVSLTVDVSGTVARSPLVVTVPAVIRVGRVPRSVATWRFAASIAAACDVPPADGCASEPMVSQSLWPHACTKASTVAWGPGGLLEHAARHEPSRSSTTSATARRAVDLVIVRCRKRRSPAGRYRSSGFPRSTPLDGRTRAGRVRGGSAGRRSAPPPRVVTHHLGGTAMQLGMIGLGRMGANMVRRLQRAGHQCVVYDPSPDAVKALTDEGATGTTDLDDFVAALDAPRNVWLMVPAAVVDSVLGQVAPKLSSGDTLIDGGNSHYPDDIRRGNDLGERGINYLDVGTSGGVFGLERGYCMMIGGQPEAVAGLRPVFEALAPGIGDVERTEGRADGAGAPGSTAEEGWLHCGPHGAGHFVKMVHNGIEYGLMAAYAEGLNILAGANVGAAKHDVDAETSPLERPDLYQYDFDLAEVTEVWRRGSVVSSWLLDLTAHALLGDPGLGAFQGRVSDSGEGRWTLTAAVDEGVPAPVLATALFNRFSSRGDDDYANRILAAMRHEFGGHVEKPAAGEGGGAAS